MVAPDDVIALAETPEIAGPTAVLLTVTEIVDAVAVLPAASLATAVRVCTVLLTFVVSHDILYEGPDPVTAEPRFAPSNWNWTPVTPTLSVALAETVTVPLTVDPFAGAVIETLGGVVSFPVVGPDTVNSSIMSSEILYPP